MFPALFGHPNSPVTQRCLGPVLQQLDGLLTTPRAPQALLQPRPIRRRQRLYPLSVTLKMFLTHWLSDDPACRTAVATAKERGWLPQAGLPRYWSLLPRPRSPSGSLRRKGVKRG